MNTFDAERHEFKKDGERVLSITQVLALAGICDWSFVAEDVRVHAMNRGKSVHWMLQLEDEGGLNYRTVPVALRGYRKAYKVWKANSGFIPLVIEKWIISDLGFGGIPDRYGTVTALFNCQVPAMVELKTGAVADWTRLQMAAQAVLIQPNISLARTIRRIGLSLRPDGTYSVKEFPLSTFDSDISTFMKALEDAKNAGSN